MARLKGAGRLVSRPGDGGCSADGPYFDDTGGDGDSPEPDCDDLEDRDDGPADRIAIY